MGNSAKLVPLEPPTKTIHNPNQAQEGAPKDGHTTTTTTTEDGKVWAMFRGGEGAKRAPSDGGELVTTSPVRAKVTRKKEEPDQLSQACTIEKYFIKKSEIKGAANSSETSNVMNTKNITIPQNSILPDPDNTESREKYQTEPSTVTRNKLLNDKKARQEDKCIKVKDKCSTHKVKLKRSTVKKRILKPDSEGILRSILIDVPNLVCPERQISG